MAVGRFAEAVPIYQELCRALPQNPGLRLNLALAYQMSGQHSLAVPEFERVLSVDPANAPALLSLGASWLSLNQPAKAIVPLQKVVAIQPGDVNSRGLLANALLAEGRPREALPHFRKLTALTPDDPKSWYGLGRTCEALATAAFQQLDKTAQGSPEWLALIAETRTERRQYRSAFYFYKQALEKNSNLPGLHEGLAEVYRRSGHADWAEVELKKAKAARPDCTRDRQACDFLAGRYQDAAVGPSLFWQVRANNQLALSAFRQLGKLPPSLESHSLKAEMLASRGQYLEAAQEWKAAGQLAPGNPRITQQLAAALYDGGDFAGAFSVLEPLLHQDPRSPELNYRVGECLLRMEQPDKAIPFLESAVRSDNRLLPARAALGLAYVRTGREAEAVEHLKAALGGDEDGSLHFQLSRALQRTGDQAGAKQAMAQYTEIRQRSENAQQDLEQNAQITAP